MLEKAYSCYSKTMNKPLKNGIAVGSMTLFGVVSVVLAGAISYFGAQAATAKVTSDLGTRVSVVEIQYENLEKKYDRLQEGIDKLVENLIFEQK